MSVGRDTRCFAAGHGDLGYLQMNQTAANQGQRAHGNENPKKKLLKDRSNAHFAQSLHGEASAYQVKHDRQADDAEMLERRVGRLEDAHIGVGHCG